MVEPRGIEPQLSIASETADSPQNQAKPKQTSALSPAPEGGKEQKGALSKQNLNTPERQKCATCVQQVLPTDLASVVAAWDGLSGRVKAQIAVLVQTTCQ